MMYDNILVGTDGTAIMDAVFDKCAYLVQLKGATIHVAHVLDITGLGSQPIDTTWEEMDVSVKSEARRILEVAREALMKISGRQQHQLSRSYLKDTRLKR